MTLQDDEIMWLKAENKRLRYAAEWLHEDIVRPLPATRWARLRRLTVAAAASSSLVLVVTGFGAVGTVTDRLNTPVTVPDFEGSGPSSNSFELTTGESVERIDLTGNGVIDVYIVGDRDPQPVPQPEQRTPWWERTGLLAAALLGSGSGVVGIWLTSKRAAPVASPEPEPEEPTANL